MTTTTGIAPVAEPEVRHRLRRLPPPSIRNARALLMFVAGFGLTALFVVLLGLLIGVRGAFNVVLPLAAITIPVAVICWGVVRLTRTRQKWALALALLTSGALALALG